MLRIRLRRVGKKGRPYYRIVVTERRNPRDGAYIDGIGHYDPMADPPAVTLDAGRAVSWLRKGAQPSDPVRRIFEYHGISGRADAGSAADLAPEPDGNQDENENADEGGNGAGVVERADG